ncbi:MAG: ribonuclease-3 [Planctomycetota bacterium]|jgi:ribonuclease-3
MKDFSTIEEALGITFVNKDLLKQAFIHRSYINEHPNIGLHHNERLEFLGDAVLELVITHELYLKYPDTPEGQLTAYRSALVRTESISDAARVLNMDDYLLLSKGEARDTGKARSYILANTFESFTGALYLDQGYDAAKAFIASTLFPRMQEVVDKGLWRDAKSYVQEKAQEVFSITPSYEVLDEEGPDHDKEFTIGIMFGGKEIATGTGTSKQEAEQNAAQAAIEVHKW